MKEIKLTRGYVALVDDEDFDRINSFKWCASGRPNYIRAVRRTSLDRIVYMHHEILQMTRFSFKEVDHLDRNPLNNSKKNLRIVSHRENTRNQLKVINSTGVDFHKATGKWRARKDRRTYLGLFGSKEEAIEAVKRSR